MNLAATHARTTAERHRCDYCHASPGESCRDRHTGRELNRQPAHLTRLRAAGVDPADIRHTDTWGDEE